MEDTVVFLARNKFISVNFSIAFKEQGMRKSLSPRNHNLKKKQFNPIKAGGSISMYRLGGRPTLPPPHLEKGLRE